MSGKSQKSVFPGLLIVVASVENKNVKVAFGAPKGEPSQSGDFQNVPVIRFDFVKVSLGPVEVQE